MKTFNRKYNKKNKQIAYKSILFLCVMYTVAYSIVDILFIIQLISLNYFGWLIYCDVKCTSLLLWLCYTLIFV